MQSVQKRESLPVAGRCFAATGGQRVSSAGAHRGRGVEGSVHRFINLTPENTAT